MALIHCNFFSQVLGMSSSMTVILPDPVPLRAGIILPNQTKYPVLYLLHGLSDDHTTWLRQTAIERYAARFNLAVVMPFANRSFYTDMAHGHKYWTFISEELPFIARSLFPLSELRGENFVAGLSMGGYGAFKLALTHPDRFIAAASLSGAVNIASSVKEAYGTRKAEFETIFGDLETVESTEKDLFHLTSNLVQRRIPKPRFYQCCGTEDFLYNDNIRFRDFAIESGLDLTYEEGRGSHEWQYWDQQIQKVLEWLPLERNKKN